MKHSKATKRRLSEMRRGEKNPFFGKRHTAETKAKLGGILRQFSSNREYDISPPTVRIPDQLALSYLAGIVDGEGSIRFRRNRPFLAIYNSDKSLGEWMGEQTGIAVKITDNRGRVPCWTWTVQSAANVYVVCLALLPLLIVKRAEAIAVIEHLEQKYGEKVGRYRGC